MLAFCEGFYIISGGGTMKNLVIIFFVLLIRHFWSSLSVLIALVLAYFLMRSFFLEVCGEIVKLFQ